METIVVGFDGSEPAGRALTRAADLAEALPARLVVVSVQPSGREVVTEPQPGAVDSRRTQGGLIVPGPPPLPGGGLAPPPPPPRTEVEVEPTETPRRHLEEARRRLTGRDLDADYVAELGRPEEQLLALAAEREAPVLVLGTREHGLLGRVLGSSVDEAVVRRATCDLLLVH